MFAPITQMHLGRVAIAVWVALVLSGFAAGCGSGGGDEHSMAVGPLTKSEWLKKANSICVKGSHEMSAMIAVAWKRYGVASAHTSEATEDEVAASMLPVRKQELRSIRALGLPRDDAASAAKLLSAWEEGIEKGERDPHSLRESGEDFAFAKSYASGIDYGLVKCWLA